MPRQNKVIRRQSREIIFNVLQFMRKEKEEGVKDVNAVQLRVAKATGTSVRTVRRIITEANTADANSVFQTPGKNRLRRRPITELDNFDRGAIKRYIHHYHETEKQTLTINKLLVKLQNDFNYEGGASSLRKIVKDLGFRWQKATNKKIMIEKTDIRLKRIEYLDKLKKYRDEGRTIVYMGESYVHSVSSQTKSSSDDTQDVKRPVTKGQRIIMVHAGSECSGFVPNSLFMFKSGTRSSDKSNIYFNNYAKWIHTQLIPNLSPNSVVVMDSALYKNKILNRAPTANSPRAEIESWLSERGIPFNKDMYKPQLHCLIKQNEDEHKDYLIDNIFAESNHSVLRLPPYHPDLNPMEMVWGAVKDDVALAAAKNMECTTNHTMELVKAKVDMMGQEDWAALCSKVKEVEEEYRKSDHAIDEMTEHFNITAETSDNSESESESEYDSDSSDNDESMIAVESKRRKTDLQAAVK